MHGRRKHDLDYGAADGLPTYLIGGKSLDLIVARDMPPISLQFCTKCLVLGASRLMLTFSPPGEQSQSPANSPLVSRTWESTARLMLQSDQTPFSYVFVKMRCQGFTITMKCHLEFRLLKWQTTPNSLALAPRHWPPLSDSGVTIT